MSYGKNLRPGVAPSSNPPLPASAQRAKSAKRQRPSGVQEQHQGGKSAAAQPRALLATQASSWHRSLNRKRGAGARKQQGPTPNAPRRFCPVLSTTAEVAASAAAAATPYGSDAAAGLARGRRAV
jgi:hypothetical protein